MTRPRPAPHEEASFDPAVLFYTPSELAAIKGEFADYIVTAPRVRWRIASVDREMIPLKPGDVMGLMARPGHGKTTIAAFLANGEAHAIVQRGAAEKECVLYIGLEPKAEEMEVMFYPSDTYTVSDLMWGRVKPEVVRQESLGRSRLPIWYMGRSIMRPRPLQPRLTAENIYRGIGSMKALYGVRPTLVVIDYIQILPIGRTEERNTQVTEAINRSKEVVDAVGCPLVMCVQAGRGVDQREDKMPTLSDCQWSSALEQVADKLFGIWRPYLTFGKSKRAVTIDGTDYEITKDLILLRQQKQRFESAGQWFPLRFQPQWVRLSELESGAELPPL